MVGGIDQEPIVAERVQNSRSLWRGLSGQLGDRRCGLGKLVVQKLGQRVVDGVGAGGGCEHKQRDDAKRA